MTLHRYCDGLPRRDFLQAGALGAVGLSLAGYLRASRAGEVAPAAAKAGIFINLGGGPSHMDTFDLKPTAPTESAIDYTRSRNSPVCFWKSGDRDG